jgi:hypothetical protein
MKLAKRNAKTPPLTKSSRTKRQRAEKHQLSAEPMGRVPGLRTFERPRRSDPDKIIRSQIGQVVSQDREEQKDAPNDRSRSSDFVTEPDNQLNRKNRIEKSGKGYSKNLQNLVHAIGLLQILAQFGIKPGNYASEYHRSKANQQEKDQGGIRRCALDVER